MQYKPFSNAHDMHRKFMCMHTIRMYVVDTATVVKHTQHMFRVTSTR